MDATFKMKYSLVISTFVIASLSLCEAYVNPNVSIIRRRAYCKTVSQQSPFVIKATEDCGCETTFTGKPSSYARNEINHRNALAKVPIYKIDGTLTTIDDIIGDSKESKNQKKTSLVVFLRSLG